MKTKRDEDIEKLEPLVRKELQKDFAGQRLEDATQAVTEAMLLNFPDILTSPDGYASKDTEDWEEFVFDCAAREGY